MAQIEIPAAKALGSTTLYEEKRASSRLQKNSLGGLEAEP